MFMISWVREMVNLHFDLHHHPFCPSFPSRPLLFQTHSFQPTKTQTRNSLMSRPILSNKQCQLNFSRLTDKSPVYCWTFSRSEIVLVNDSKIRRGSVGERDCSVAPVFSVSRKDQKRMCETRSEQVFGDNFVFVLYVVHSVLKANHTKCGVETREKTDKREGQV